MSKTMSDYDIAQKEFEQRQWKLTHAPKVYTWLGEHWNQSTFRKKTFANFLAERQEEAFKIVQGWGQDLTGNLVLHGAFGVGKTHLLAALCNALIERYKASRFTNVVFLFEAMQARQMTGQAYSDLLYEAGTTPLLVLDDIDKAKWSEFREQTYYSILLRRAENGLPTALSTNRIGDLGNYIGSAALSRLTIGLVDVEMKGNDYRLEL